MATLKELLKHKATLEAEVAYLREDIASIDATISEMVAQESMCPLPGQECDHDGGCDSCPRRQEGGNATH